MDYLDAVELQQGFVARSDVLALGLDDRFIRRQIAGRTWTRIRNGAYCSTREWETLDAVERHRRLSRAVLRAHGDAVVLSNVSGLLMRTGCEVWGPDLTRVHVTRRDGRSGSVERDVVHHQAPLGEDEIEVVDGLLVTREPRCLVETISSCRVESGLVATDSTLRAGRVTRDELEALHAQKRWRRGRRSADLTLRLADGRAESVGESRARYLYWSQGLPHPEVQFHVFDADGVLVGVTDLAWPQERLLFEFDGRIKYGRLVRADQTPGDVVFEEKRREDALRRVTGFAVERITWADLSRPVVIARRARQRMTVATSHDIA
ncbi:MAG: hypothetical protein ABI776_11115 [Nocardioidaceae bacterium]